MAKEQRRGDRHREKRVSIGLRIGDGKREAWKAAAGREGMSLSAWLKRAADRAVEIESKQETIRKVALS